MIWLVVAVFFNFSQCDFVIQQIRIYDVQIHSYHISLISSHPQIDPALRARVLLSKIYPALK